MLPNAETQIDARSYDDQKGEVVRMASEYIVYIDKLDLVAHSCSVLCGTIAGGVWRGAKQN